MQKNICGGVSLQSSHFFAVHSNIIFHSNLEEKIMRNKQKVTSKEPKVTSNEQRAKNSEQRATSKK